MAKRFYELQTFYYRDVYFTYSDKNTVSYFDVKETDDLSGGLAIYEVDVLDEKLNQYDVLPTIGPVLIKNNLKNIFFDALRDDVIFFDAMILDGDGNKNSDFSMMVIKKTVSCLDRDRSEVQMKTYSNGSTLMRIKKLVLDASKIDDSDIFLMSEKKSYIIVNESFKRRLSKFKGFNFVAIES